MFEITTRQLHNFKCRYHRNGCGGEGFFLCSFTYQKEALQAVVFDGPGQCAVISPDLNNRFRGDNFEEPLRLLIEEASKTDAPFTYAA